MASILDKMDLEVAKKHWNNFLNLQIQQRKC